jgi:mycoredoxin
VVRYVDIHAIDDRPDNEEVRKVLRQIAEEEAAGKDTVAAKNIPANVGPITSPGIYFDEPQDEDEIPQAEIVVYCAQWCKDCRKAKAWLDERRLKYVEVDIDYNMTARKQVRQWANGFLVTPVINFDGAIILDFDPTKLEEALRKRG